MCHKIWDMFWQTWDFGAQNPLLYLIAENVAMFWRYCIIWLDVFLFFLSHLEDNMNMIRPEYYWMNITTDAMVVVKFDDFDDVGEVKTLQNLRFLRW